MRVSIPPDRYETSLGRDHSQAPSSRMALWFEGRNGGADDEKPIVTCARQ